MLFLSHMLAEREGVGALAGIQRLGSSLSTAKVGGLKNHARTEKKELVPCPSVHALVK
jgi:hypothetical protein